MLLMISTWQAVAICLIFSPFVIFFWILGDVFCDGVESYFSPKKINLPDEIKIEIVKEKPQSGEEPTSAKTNKEPHPEQLNSP